MYISNKDTFKICLSGTEHKLHLCDTNNLERNLQTSSIEKCNETKNNSGVLNVFNLNNVEQVFKELTKTLVTDETYCPEYDTCHPSKDKENCLKNKFIQSRLLPIVSDTRESEQLNSKDTEAYNYNKDTDVQMPLSSESNTNSCNAKVDVRNDESIHTSSNKDEASVFENNDNNNVELQTSLTSTSDSDSHTTIIHIKNNQSLYASMNQDENCISHLDGRRQQTLTVYNVEEGKSSVSKNQSLNISTGCISAKDKICRSDSFESISSEEDATCNNPDYGTSMNTHIQQISDTEFHLKGKRHKSDILVECNASESESVSDKENIVCSDNENTGDQTALASKSYTDSCNTKVDVRKYQPVYSDMKADEASVFKHLEEKSDGTFYCNLCKLSIGSNRNCISHVNEKEHQLLAIVCDLREEVKSLTIQCQSLPCPLDHIEHKTSLRPADSLESITTEEDTTSNNPDYSAPINMYLKKTHQSNIFVESNTRDPKALNYKERTVYSDNEKAELLTPLASKSDIDSSNTKIVVKENGQHIESVSRHHTDTNKGKAATFDHLEKKSNGELYCTVCKVSIGGNGNCISHLNGSKHQAQLLVSDITKKATSTTGKNQSLKSSKAEKLTYTDTKKGEASAFDHLEKKSIGEFYCNICKVSISSEKNCISHLNGSKHQAQLLVSDITKKATSTTGKNQSLKSGMGSVKYQDNLRPSDSFESMSSKKSDTSNNLSSSGSTNFGLKKMSDSKYYCEACDALISGKNNCGLHLKGKRHMSNISAKNDTKKPGTLNSQDKTAYSDNVIAEVQTPLPSKTNSNSSSTKVVVKNDQLTYIDTKKGEASAFDHLEKKSNGELYCTVCKVSIGGDGNCISHLNGSKHQAQLLVSDITKKATSTTGKNQSLQSSKAEKLTYTDTKKGEASAFDHLEKKSIGEFYCNICKVSISSEKNCISHLNGSKHQAQLLVSDITKKATSTTGKNQSLKSGMGSVKYQDNLRPSDSFESMSSKKSDTSNNLSSSGSTNFGLKKMSDSKYYCEACDALISGKNNCGLHLKGKRHMSNISAKNDTKKPGTLNSQEKTAYSDNVIAEVQTPLPSKTNSNSSSTKVVVKNDQLTYIDTKKGEASAFDHLEKKSNGELYCTVCKVSIGGDGNCISHLNGSKHQAQLLVSDITKKATSTTGKNQSLQSSKAEKLTYTDTKKGEASAFDHLEKKSIGEFYCNICKVSISSEKNCISHLNGSKHQAQLLVSDITKKATSTTGKNQSLKSGMGSVKDQDSFETPSDSFESTSSKESGTSNNLSSSGSTNFDLKKIPDSEYYCKYCNAVMYGKNNCRLHLKGRTHMSNISAKDDTKKPETLNSQEKMAYSDNMIAEVQTPLPSKTNSNSSSTKVVVKNDQLTYTDTKKGEASAFDHLEKKSNGEFYCNICKVPISGDKNCISHLNGSKHQAQLLVVSDITKKATSTTGKNQSLKSGMGSVKDQDSFETPSDSFESTSSKESGTSNNLSSSGSTNFDLKKISDSEYYCKYCNAVMYGKNNCRLHLKGRTHMSNIPAKDDTKKPETLNSQEKMAYSDNMIAEVQTPLPSKTNSNSSSTKVVVKNDQLTYTNTKKGEASAFDHLEKKSNGELYCTVCKVSIGDDGNCISHLNGSKHQAQLLVSDITKKATSTTGKNQSLKSGKAEKLTYPDTKKEEASAFDHLVKKSNRKLYCTVCKMFIGSDENCISHLNGIDHQAQLLTFNITKIVASTISKSQSLKSGIVSAKDQDSFETPSDSFESTSSKESGASNNLSCSRSTNFYLKKISDFEYYCKYCNAVINGKDNCELHLTSRRHMSNMFVESDTKEPEPLDYKKRTVNYDIAIDEVETPLASESDTDSSSTKAVVKNDHITCTDTDVDIISALLYFEKKSNGLFYCNVCKVSISGKENCISHLSGRKHQTRLRVSGITETATLTTIKSESLNSSIDSVKIQDELHSSESFESTSSKEDSTANNLSCSTPINMYLKKLSDSEFYCEACDAIIRGEYYRKLHLKGKRHMANIGVESDKGELEPLNYKERSVDSDKVIAEVRTPLTSESDTDSSDTNVVVNNGQQMYTNTNRDEAPNFDHLEKKPNGEFYCTVCEVSIGGDGNCISHLNGLKHLAYLWVSGIPEKTTLTTIESQSLNSSTDISSEEDVTSNNLSYGTSTNTYLTKLSDFEFYCEARDAVISGEDECELHLKGRRHMSNIFVESNTRDLEALNYKEGIAYSDSEKAEVRTPLTFESDANSSSTKVVAKNAQPTNTDRNKNDATAFKHLEKTSNGIFYCIVCKASIGRDENCIPHLNGKKHKDKMLIFENTEKVQLISKSQSLHSLEVQTPLASTADIDSCITKVQWGQLLDVDKSKDHEKIQRLQDQIGEASAIVGDSIQFTEKLNDKSTNKCKKSNDCKDKDWVMPMDVYTELFNLTKYLSMKIPTSKASKKKSSQISIKENKRKSAAVICNQRYDTDLFFFEERAFDCDIEQKFKIETSTKLTVIDQGQYRKCLLCNTSFPDNVNYFYDHVHSAEHHKNILSMENNYKLCKSISQDMTNCELLQKGLKITSRNSVECLLCACQIKNDEDEINVHVSKKDHKKKEKKWKTETMDFEAYIEFELSDYWYSIQWFSCAVCNVNFDLKISFVQHLQEKHRKVMEGSTDLLFDFCIPCASLWLGYKDTYTMHCTYVTHKRLLQNNDFGVFYLPDIARDLLCHISDNVSKFHTLSESVLSDTEEQKNLTNALEETLRLKYPDIKAYTFGSRFNGLGLPNSDIDIYIDMENTYYLKVSKEKEVYYLNEVESLLLKNKDKWEVLDVLKKSRTPIIKLEYRPTGMKCDISFTNGLAVENTKLLRAYNTAFLNCRLLILFLKRWLSLCNLSGPKHITNYALAWLVVFYLQRKLNLPSVATLIKEADKKRYISGWEIGDNYNIRVDPKHHNSDFEELLLRFFEFYSLFDFRYEIVCPLLGDSVLKRALASEDTLPDEMRSYKFNLTTSDDPEFFRIDSCMCIQDPLDLSHNLTKGVQSLTLKTFKYQCLESARIISANKLKKGD